MSIPIFDIVLYLQRSKKKIREFVYSFENDTYVSPDMTILAQHLFDSDIKSMAYQQEPFSILWCVKANGTLLGFTYSRAEQVTAWHKHTTDGLFENVACIYGLSGNNELWAVVNRTIGGVTKRYIEMLEDPFDDTTLNSNECFFVDSGLSYDGVPTTTISGLTHLEGKTVAVLADGLVQTSKVVTGGSITLSPAASKVHAGLPYTSTLQTMRVEAADGEGTSQGRKKRTNQVVFRFYKAKQFKYGLTPAGTLKEITFTSLFSGDKEVDFPSGWDRTGTISIINEKPLPITVVAIVPEVAVS